jgi:hypothetical protein
MSEGGVFLGARDYKYIIGYFILIIVGIFTFYYGTKENEIVSYLGFAGTVSSLILSVVALIYTFFQSTSTINHSKKLSKTSNKFTKAVEELRETQEQLSVSVETVMALGMQVATVDYKMDYVTQILEKPANYKSSSTSVPLNDGTDNLSEILLSTSSFGLLSLVICFYQSQNPLPKDLKTIIEEAFESNNSSDYCYGYLIAFEATKLIEIEYLNNGFKPVFSDPELMFSSLKIAMEFKINKEHGDYLKGKYFSIVKYYGFDLNFID